jgi:signal transduction histidine kinase
MSSQQESEASDRQPYKRKYLLIYTTCISGLGIALCVWALLNLSSSLPNVLLFLGLVAVSEIINIEAFAPQISFSISSAVAFATLLYFGPLPGALAGAVGGFAATLTREIADRHRERPRAPFLQRVLFNMAGLSLSLFVAGQVYILLGGRIGEVSLLSNVLPMIVAAVVAEFTNAAVILGAVSLQTGMPVYRLWLENFSWAVPISILGMVVGGGGLALGYQIAGLLGAIVFFLPIALTVYAFRLYVVQTKAQMEHLEEIITERTEDLQRANKELRQLDRLKTSFFAVINHELRSPLTAIIGYTELLLSHGSLLPDQLEMLNKTRENGRRLLDLANNLLDISRIEDGKLVIAPQALDVMDAVRRAMEVIKPLADQKHIAVIIGEPGTAPQVYADPRRVDQILVNLLSNAIKYTPDTGSVVVTAQGDGDANMAKISVADNGIGIPAELLDLVFDRFVRAERADLSDTMGTGLGLSIAKGLVEAQGGEIWVDSVERYGTVFTFTLPLAEQALDDEPAPAQASAEEAELEMA